MMQNISKFFSFTILTLIALYVLYCFGIKRMGSGTSTTEQAWFLENYKILFIKDQGWAGSARYRYELHKKLFIPIFSEKIESISTDDSINVTECVVNFPENKVSFDKCTEIIKKNK